MHVSARTPSLSAAAMMLPEVFTTLYINTRNFKFISPKISHFCFVTAQGNHMRHYFLINPYPFIKSDYVFIHRMKHNGDLEC